MQRTILSVALVAVVATGPALASSSGVADPTRVESPAFHRPEPPTDAEVLRAVPVGTVLGDDGRVERRLTRYRVGPIRLYPLVGPARLIEVRFKCVATGNRGRAVVFWDGDHLIPAER
jgi:hypothetical protein